MRSESQEVGACWQAISWHGRLARVAEITGGTPVPLQTIACKQAPTCRGLVAREDLAP